MVERVHVGAELAGMADGLRERLPDIEVVVLDPGEQAFLDALPRMEALFGFRPPRGHWGEADALQLLQLPGAGVDSVLPAPDLPDRVRLCNAVGTHLPEMSEWVVGMVQALHLGVPQLVDQQRERRWSWVWHGPLTGRRAVVIGLGHIGADIAVRLRAVGLAVDGVSRSGRPVDGIDRAVPVERRAEVLTGADVVVVVVPLTEETAGLVGSAELGALAEGAVLVDVSRGGVVDTTALVEALDRGPLRAAALDVFEEEPLPTDDPLWDVPGLLVTPHTAAISPEYFGRLVDLAAENVRRVADGRPALNLVDRERGY